MTNTERNEKKPVKPTRSIAEIEVDSTGDRYITLIVPLVPIDFDDTNVVTYLQSYCANKKMTLKFWKITPTSEIFKHELSCNNCGEKYLSENFFPNNDQQVCCSFCREELSLRGDL